MSIGSRTLSALLLTTSLCLVGAAAYAQQSDFVSITDEILNNPDDADWPQYRRTHNNWAFSPLDQVNRDNVEFLQLAWSRTVGAGRIESTPLVYDGVMYIVHPNSVVEAVDATNGNLIWRYERELPEGVNPTGVNRNIALYGDNVYYSSRDNYLVAINARTGQVEWETLMSDDRVVSHSSGPIAHNGVIVTGRSCNPGASFDGGCFIMGHDANSGELLWRVNTIAAPGEPGGDSWGGLPYENRYHVSPWGVSSYDPELGLIYIGTGVPGPYPSIAQGRNEDDALYSDSTLAINIETGDLEWYFQHLPGDDWDLDNTGERILVDLPIDPSDEVEWSNPDIDPMETRRVLWMANKGGIQFVLDRETGEFLWADPILHQNVVLGVDPDGTVHVDSSLRHKEIGDTVIVGQRAAKNYWPGTYSPLTGAVYQPLHNSWLQQTSLEWAGAGMGAARISIRAPENTESLGAVKAINVSTGEVLWEQFWPTIHTGGLVSTGGGLVFGGDYSRAFRAYDDTTGEVLWQSLLNSRISGGAISYEVEGVQYIAVTAGGGSIYEGVIDLAPEGLEQPDGGNSVFVFALPASMRE